MSSTTVLNLDSDTAKNIIGSEDTPILTITNGGTGPSMEIDKIVVSSGATITASALTATKLYVTPGALTANATIVGLNLYGPSTASGSALSLKNGGFVSCSTINFTTAAVAGLGAIRVTRTDGTFGWIPVMPDAAVTAAAVE